MALVPEPVRSLAVDGVAYRALADVDQRTDLVLATRPDGLSASVPRVVELLAASATANAALTS